MRFFVTLLLAAAAFGQVSPQQRAVSIPAFVPNYNIPGRPLLSGLNISVGTGTLLINGIPTTYPAVTLAVANNTTSYVYVDLSSGLLTQNTTGFTASDYPICTAQAVGGIITTLTDSRPDIFGSTAVTGVQSFNARTGTVVLTLSDVTGVFSGTCNSSTFLRGDGACATAAGGVTSFNSRTGVVLPVANDYTWDLIGAGSNLLAQSMGTGGSMSPLNLGQVAGSQAWLAPGISVPAITGTNSGGTVAQASIWSLQYTLNSALGESLPSILSSGSSATTLSGSVCASNLCTLSITAPTLPSGYTSYTAYACTTSGGGCTVPQKLAGCTAITGNCVITAPVTANTSGVPTTNTSIIQPPNVQAFNGLAGEIPSLFFPKTDGNNYPWVSVDWKSCDASAGPPLPCGTPVFTHRTYANDSTVGLTAAGTQTYKNSFWSINHQLGVGTVTTNQDRGLAVHVTGPVGDSTARYGWEAIQAEADWVGTSSATGAVDSEITAGSFQTSDTHAGAINEAGLGVNGVRSSVDRSSSGTTGSCRNSACYVGGLFQVYNNNNSSMGGLAYAGIVTEVYSQSGTPADIGYGVLVAAPATHGSRFTGLNVGVKIADYGTNTADWNIFSTSTNGTATSGRNWFGGNVYLPNIFTAANTISVNGAIADTGSLSAGQLPTPTAPTTNVTGTTGTTYTYLLVGKDANGGSTAASSTTNASAAGTLNGSNFVAVCLGGAVTNVTNGYSAVDVYRSVSGGIPASVGKIGTITVTNTTTTGGANCLTDNGLAGDTTTAPTINTTGTVKAFSVLTTTNCAAVGTAASPSVASCSAASAGSFSCATNAVNTCTVNTTAVTANSQIFISQREDTTTGTRLGVTCNTTPSVVIASEDITAVVAGTSFSFGLTQPVTNPNCYSYLIVN